MLQVYARALLVVSTAYMKFEYATLKIFRYYSKSFLVEWSDKECLDYVTYKLQTSKYRQWLGK